MTSGEPGAPSSVPPRDHLMVGVCGLVALLCLEVGVSVSRQSQTWDEGAHIWAGYRYWQCGDTSIDVGNPPLLKALAAVPLIFKKLQVPAGPCGTDPLSTEFVYGRTFMHANDEATILGWTRLFSGVSVLLLVVLSFVAGRTMFGGGAALIALLLAVFEPNLVAHGALVTNDAGAACLIFAAVYSYYLYTRKRTLGRLIASGLIVGLALSAKHSSVVVLPTLALLAVIDAVLQHRRGPGTPARSVGSRSMRLCAELAVMGALSLVVLWGSYGFRFAAKPPGAKTLRRASLNGLLGIQSPVVLKAIPAMRRWRLLPEAYLDGLEEILVDAEVGRRMFLFGKVYESGRWFYFPAAILIKSTLGFLLLLAVALASRRLYRGERLRETLFLLVPAAVFLGASMESGIDKGLRHVLPTYAFLLLFAAAGAWTLLTSHRLGKYAVGLLLGAHILSSSRAFPDYIAYSNELWGGPSQLYRLLSDSNADWGQGLKAARSYLEERRVTDCWLAYNGTADLDSYQIPCRHLPNAFGFDPVDSVPEVLTGTVLIAAGELSGLYWGLDDLHPYAPFLGLTPVSNIGGSILVFEGRFEVPMAAAMSHCQRSWHLAEKGDLKAALFEAREAVDRAPRSAAAHYALGHVLAQLNEAYEARGECRTALELAQSSHAEFEKRLILSIRRTLHGLRRAS